MLEDRVCAEAGQHIADSSSLETASQDGGDIYALQARLYELSSSLLVMQAFTRHNVLFVLAAIVWHATVDGIAVYSVSTWGVVETELIIGLTTIPAIVLIWRLRDQEMASPARPQISSALF